jgi:hypothetical protein
VSDFYAQQAASAKRQIAKRGAPVTFAHTPTTASGAAGTVTDGVPVTTSSVAIRIPASKDTLEAFDLRSESGSLADREVAFVKVAAAGMAFAPKRGDAASFCGGSWEVLGCTPVNPAGTPIVYSVGMVRK